MITIIKKKDESEWTVNEKSPPQVIIRRSVLDDIFLYAQKCQLEISGLGRVVKRGLIYEIVEVVLLDQICSSAETEITTEALEKFYADLAERGGNPAEWRLWWHSHVNMGVFFSGTDDKCVDSLLGCWEDYVVSIVVNKKYEAYTRIDYKDPVRMTYDYAPLYVIDPVSEERIKQIEEEVEQKVKEENKVIIYNGVNQVDPPSVPENIRKVIAWDIFNRMWRHKQNSSRWNPYTNRWMPVKGLSETIYDLGCQACDFDRPIGQIVYSEVARLWLCPSCRQKAKFGDENAVKPRADLVSVADTRAERLGLGFGLS